MDYKMKLEPLFVNGVKGKIIGYFSKGHQNDEDFLRAVNIKTNKKLLSENVEWSYGIRIPNCNNNVWSTQTLIDVKYWDTKQSFPLTYIKI